VGGNWVVKNRSMDHNPILSMEKPEAKRRTAFVTPQESDELLKHVDDVPFHDLLIVSYDSGIAGRAQGKSYSKANDGLDRHISGLVMGSPLST
jgi:hypothetical protein